MDWFTDGVRFIVPSGEAIGFNAVEVEPNGEPQPVIAASTRRKKAANLIGCVTANGRFLRHRPERSERSLNYERFYQGQPAWSNKEGVPKAHA